MTDDRLLILDRRDMHVRLEGKALRIDGTAGLVQRAPLGLIGQVVVHGNPSVSCDVWRALAEHGISAVLLPARGQGRAAWLGAGLATSVRLRRRHHLAANEPEQRLGIARNLVRLKFEHYRRLLEVIREGHLALAWAEPADVQRSATSLRDHIGESIGHLEKATQPGGLMGTEGGAASAWWRWLAEILPAKWRFQGRNRRPPRDPVNALLSLSYTLLGAEMAKYAHERGLDPSLGFLHEIVPGRESLVLDLIEPLRPAVDAFVLSLLERALHPRDFTHSRQDGCRLNKKGRSLFYPAWAMWRRIGPEWLDPAPADEPDREGGAEAGHGSGLGHHCRRIVHAVVEHIEALDFESEGIENDE